MVHVNALWQIITRAFGTLEYQKKNQPKISTAIYTLVESEF